MTAVESLNYETSTMLYADLDTSLEVAYKFGSVAIMKSLITGSNMSRLFQER